MRTSIKRAISLTLFGFFVISCHSSNSPSDVTKPAVSSGIRQALQGAKTFSDVFEKERVLQLPSKQECLLGSCNQIVYAHGNLIAVDSRLTQQVLVFDAGTGSFRAAIGRHGNGPGEYAQPDWVAVDSMYRVLVLDGNSGRLLRYNLDGQFLSALDLSGLKLFPMRVEVGCDGLYYFMTVRSTDPNETPGNMVAVVDSVGHKIRSFVPGDPLSKRLFHVAGGLALCPHGRLFVVGPFEPVIQVWNTSGKQLAQVKRHLGDLPSPFRANLLTDQVSVRDALRVLATHTTANGLFCLDPGLLIMTSASGSSYCFTFVDAGNGEVIRGALCLTPETAGTLTSPILGAHGNSVFLVEPPQPGAKGAAGENGANLRIAIFRLKARK